MENDGCRFLSLKLNSAFDLPRIGTRGLGKNFSESKYLQNAVEWLHNPEQEAKNIFATHSSLEFALFFFMH